MARSRIGATGARAGSRGRVCCQTTVAMVACRARASAAETATSHHARRDTHSIVPADRGAAPAVERGRWVCRAAARIPGVGSRVAVMPRTRLYRNGVVEAEGFPVADVSDHLADPSATVWFDLCTPTVEDLAAISEELVLHPLAVEDAVHERRTFELRKSLVTLRRVVLPMREVVNSLLRRDLHVVDEAMLPYFQDVYDHVLRATEWTESLRDLVTTILETHLTVRGNHLNVIMKQVTSWAAIIAVPTAVTGFYGQNVPYPGFGTHWGFWTSTLVTVALSAVLYEVFCRKDWL